jgi:electron transport complex protein RnfE
MDTFLQQVWKENPVFVMALGMCPVLAVTSSATNGLAMGLASLFVLVCSNALVSALRHAIPKQVRIAAYIVIIATFVTIVDYVLQALSPTIYAALGAFIQLIVVNCIILGRAEAYAAKNPPLLALADGIGMGLGFTLALSVIAAIREILGNGSLTIWGDLAWNVEAYTPMLLAVLPPGGFITLGCLLAAMNRYEIRLAEREGRVYMPARPAECRQCVVGCWTPAAGADKPKA